LLAGVLLVRRCGLVTAQWVPFAAAAGVCLLGYVVFWAYFAHRRLGAALAIASWLAAVVFLVRERARLRAWWGDPEGGRTALACMALIGAGYIALLHLHGSPLPLEELAQQRFVPGLPADNMIPRCFAERLARGASPRNLIGDWQSSDRPPLEAGIVLLARALSKAAKAENVAAAQSAGLFFELLWVPALWGLLRELGMSLRRSAGVVALCSASGFFLLQSLYVWPKLGGAALAIGAFGLAFGTRPAPARIVAAGVCAALAWLSHGGLAFALIAMAALAPLALRGVAPKALLAAGGAFAALASPWFVYQRVYEPPGNRLLKWHLAGVVDIDARGVVETLADSYRAVGLAGAVANKRENLTTTFRGPAALLWDFSAGGAERRRDATSFHFFLALGPWNLVWVLVPWLWLRRARVRSLDLRLCALLLAWSFVTYAVWVLLLFGPQATLVHQGPLTMHGVWFPLLLALAWTWNRWLFLGLAAWHLLAFATTWPPAASRLGGETSVAAALVLGVVVAASAVAVARCGRVRRPAHPHALKERPARCPTS